MTTKSIAFVRPGTETTKENARVLVIDDDANLYEALTYALGPSGIAVTACNNPEHVMQSATDSEFDYIIAGHRALAGMDGLELTRRLRKRFPLSVIIGTSDEEMGDSFLRAGANDFLKKPFAPYRLAMMIDGDDILA